MKTPEEMARIWFEHASTGPTIGFGQDGDALSLYYESPPSPEKQEHARYGQGYWAAAADAHGEAFEGAAVELLRERFGQPQSSPESQ